MKTKPKVGRPRGSTTRWTMKAENFEEGFGDNEHLAKYGKHHNAGPGYGVAAQIWCDRNPQPSSRAVREMAHRHGITAEAVCARLKEERANQVHPLLASVVEAIDRRDAQFFRDMAIALESRREDGSIIADAPEELALLWHVREALARNAGQRFTVTGLIDSVPWRYWGTQCPSERNLARLCKKLAVPMQSGRPRKK